MSVIKPSEAELAQFDTAAGVRYLKVGRYWALVDEARWAIFDGWLKTNGSFLTLDADESHLKGAILPSLTEVFTGDARYRFVVFTVNMPMLVQWLFSSIQLRQATAGVSTINDVIDFSKTRPFGSGGPSGQEVLDGLGAGDAKSPFAPLLTLGKYVAIGGAIALGVYTLAQVATIAKVFKK